MTATEFFADNYPHNADVEHYLRTAHQALDVIERLWRSEHLDLDGFESEAQRKSDALYAVEKADRLQFAAEQLGTYLVGSARFERATWSELGEVLEVSKQAVSERYRGVAGPQRGDHIGTLTPGRP